MSENLYNKFMIVKNEDIKNYLTPTEQNILNELLIKIGANRMGDGKGTNNYLVVNQDESYADLVKKLILKDISAYEIVETIARNCVAWDTSKDKREGLLPEVAFFKNSSLYKRLTGEEYNYSKAVKKFHIGDL